MYADVENVRLARPRQSAPVEAVGDGHLIKQRHYANDLGLLLVKPHLQDVDRLRQSVVCPTSLLRCPFVLIADVYIDSCAGSRLC